MATRTTNHDYSSTAWTFSQVVLAKSGRFLAVGGVTLRWLRRPGEVFLKDLSHDTEIMLRMREATCPRWRAMVHGLYCFVRRAAMPPQFRRGQGVQLAPDTSPASTRAGSNGSLGQGAPGGGNRPVNHAPGNQGWEIDSSALPGLCRRRLRQSPSCRPPRRLLEAAGGDVAVSAPPQAVPSCDEGSGSGRSCWMMCAPGGGFLHGDSPLRTCTLSAIPSPGAIHFGTSKTRHGQAGPGAALHGQARHGAARHGF